MILKKEALLVSWIPAFVSVQGDEGAVVVIVVTAVVIPVVIFPPVCWCERGAFKM